MSVATFGPTVSTPPSDDATNTSSFFSYAFATLAVAVCLAGCNLHYDVDSVTPNQTVDPGDIGDVGDVDELGDTDPCEPEENAVLCDDAASQCGPTAITDRCGDDRTIDCGSCPNEQTCEDNACVCQGQSPDELCEAHSADACGSLSVTDRCGDERSVQCGLCLDGLNCTDDNECQSCDVDCDGQCGLVPDECGEFIDCDDDPTGQACEPGQICQDFACGEGECEPRTECEAGECGQQPDGCGGIFVCERDCAEGLHCIQNSCLCEPETDQELCTSHDIDCGTAVAIDRCGNESSIDCGDCSGTDQCENNQCVGEPGVCDGLDFDTNVEHCGDCNAPCSTAETCVDGQCETFACLEDQGSIPGDCNAVTNSGCDSDSEYCSLRLATTEGVISHFRTTCRDLEDTGDATVGDECTQLHGCQSDLLCVAWDTPDPRQQRCSKLCDRTTQEGCAEDEFCADPFFISGDVENEPELDEFGFCTARCSPDEPGACGSGQRCTADPAFPTGSCTPNFRCLFNGGSTGKTTGDECTRAELHSDGCPSSHTCAPIDDQERCVQPCSADSDCPGDCINAAPPWQMLRYCALD